MTTSPNGPDQTKETLSHSALAIRKWITKTAQEFKEEEKKLNTRDKIVRPLRTITILSACVTFLLVFHYPEYVAILIPFSLICFVFLIPAENLWLSSLQEKRENARKKADPTTANQALSFLKKPRAHKHIEIMLDEPSEKEEYQLNYIDMLVHLGAACEWIESKRDHLETTRDSMQDILNAVYSSYTRTYDPKFLKEWKSSFEELQHEVKGYFGENLTVFEQKSGKKPLFFLNCFRAFVRSDTGKKLKSFLRFH